MTQPLAASIRARAVLVVAMLTATLVPVLATDAAADGRTERQLVAATNAVRAHYGLRRYAVAADLTAVARRWAAHMAARHVLAHNPRYTSQVCCWRRVGENVGVGPNAGAVERAFMASARHRANILSRSFTQIGIGTARGSDGRLYVDEVFRQPRSGSTTAAAGAAGPLDEVVVAMVLTPEPALPPE